MLNLEKEQQLSLSFKDMKHCSALLSFFVILECPNLSVYLTRKHLISLMLLLLFTEAMLDWVLISGYEAFNKEKLVFTCCTCKCTWSKEEFHVLKDEEFFMQSFVATASLKKLRLRKDELAILKALAIFSPGKHDYFDEYHSFCLREKIDMISE